MNATDPSPTQPAGHAHEAATVRTAPLALWRVAQAFLGVLQMLFGAPETVAAKHTLTTKAHAQMASWLRSAEAMLRRLITIEASAYPKPNTRPLLHAHRPRTKKLRLFAPDEPRTWRVSFRMFISPARRKAGSSKRSPNPGGGERPVRAVIIRAEPAPPRESRRNAKRTSRKHHPPILRQDRPWRVDHERETFRSAWPLAERYEALLRAFNNPAPYARRAATRLHAMPHRLSEALRAPPEAAHRIEAFDECRECAERRWRAHFSSA